MSDSKAPAGRALRDARLALTRALDAARRGRLYPAVILHGATDEARRAAAAELGRVLLCAQAPEARPCGECRHCRRIVAPPRPDAESKRDRDEGPFHPDFAVLERDLKTSISADGTREFVRDAQLHPFEARGQVFVVAEADALSGEAANALLRVLEEPGLGAPRHFLLLAPSRLDLLPTLRSRSQSIFLGPAVRPDPDAVAAAAAGVAGAVARFDAGGDALHLLDAAARLGAGADFEDPRASAPWTLAAAAARGAALDPALPAGARRRLLELALDLLVEAPALRLRGIPAGRILEGLVSRRLAP